MQRYSNTWYMFLPCGNSRRRLHLHHLVLALAVFPTTLAASRMDVARDIIAVRAMAGFQISIARAAPRRRRTRSCGRGRAAVASAEDAPTKEDRLELAVPTPPRGQAHGCGRRGHHGEPPHRVARQRACVERDDDEVEEVNREGKVGDEFAAGDEDDNGHGPARKLG